MIGRKQLYFHKRIAFIEPEVLLFLRISQPTLERES